MDYKIFTSNLANLQRYRNMKRELEEKLDLMVYEETGVKGISYDRMPVSHNPTMASIRRLDMVEKVDQICRELNFIALAIEEVENIMSRMPDELQKMLKEIFVQGETYRKVGMEHGYSDSGFWHYLKRETERYL